MQEHIGTRHAKKAISGKPILLIHKTQFNQIPTNKVLLETYIQYTHTHTHTYNNYHLFEFE